MKTKSIELDSSHCKTWLLFLKDWLRILGLSAFLLINIIISNDILYSLLTTMLSMIKDRNDCSFSIEFRRNLALY